MTYIDVGNIETTRSNIGSNQNVSCSRFELVQRAQPAGLTELPMQRDRPKAKGTKQDSNSLRLVDSPRKNDGRLSGEFVYHVYQVHVLVHVRDEDVVLDQSLDSLVLARTDADSDRIAERGTLKTLDF